MQTTTRQAFELEIAHDRKRVRCRGLARAERENLVKIGRACYGCMKGTTIFQPAEYSDGSEATVLCGYRMEKKVVESIGLTIIAGSIMMAIGSLSLIGLGVTRRAFKGSTTSPKDSKDPSIEVLEATEGKPVRFRINDPPSSGSAWVGIYPFGAEDEDHGEEGEMELAEGHRCQRRIVPREAQGVGEHTCILRRGLYRA